MQGTPRALCSKIDPFGRSHSVSKPSTGMEGVYGVRYRGYAPRWAQNAHCSQVPNQHIVNGEVLVTNAYLIWRISYGHYVVLSEDLI